MKCKNCGSEVTTNFCGQCGQEANVPRLTVKEIFIQFFQVMTKADSSLPGFIKDLLIKPGIVAKEYAEGKRKKYYNPFRYLIFIVGLYAILSLENIDSKQNYDSSINNDEMKNIVQLELFYHNNHKAIILLMLPLAALVSNILFYRSGYNFAENLLLNILIQSQLILFDLLIITPIITISTNFDSWIFLFYLLLSLIYFVWSYTQFFPGKNFWINIKSFFCFFIIYFLNLIALILILKLLNIL